MIAERIKRLTIVVFCSSFVSLGMAGAQLINEDMEQKQQLFLIPGATHIKTYYVPEYVDQAVGKLVGFFSSRL